MKKIKRIFASILILVLMVTAIPEICISSFATATETEQTSDSEATDSKETDVATVEVDEETDSAEEQVSETVTYATATTSEIVTDTVGEITRAEWLHNLVVVFDMTVESEALPDNYFSDLDETHEYYEDIILAVEFGIVDVEAGAELRPDDGATRDFAVSTLNFCLGYQFEEDTTYTYTDSDSCTNPVSAQIAINRGWVEMIDGCFSPETYLTSAEAKVMIADAQTILAGQVIDVNHENIYEFTEDVIVIADGTVVAEGEDGTILITDCPETISVGDKFAVHFNGIPNVYTATSVTTEENVTIIGREEVETDSAFETIDVEGTIAADAMEIVPAEGVEVSLEEDIAGVSTFGVKGLRDIKAEMPLKYNGVTGKLSVKIKNPYIEYSADLNRAFVTLNGTTEVTYSISGNLLEMGGLNSGFTLFTCNIAGVGSFDVTVNVNFSGSASGTVKGYLVAGVEVENGVGIRAIRSFTQKEYYANVDASASVSLKAFLGVTKMPVLKAYVYAEAGIMARFQKTSYSDENKPTECAHYAAYLFASFGASASAKFGFWQVSENISHTIFDESNSPVRIVNHYEDGDLVVACTRGTSYANYFTKASSRWSGCGWTGANGTYALNADGTPFVLYNYTLDENNQATITKYNGNAWSVYIPKEIDGYTVVGIGTEAFRYKDVGYVVIPDTVIKIGFGAFQGCTNLKTVVLSNTLTTISGEAFYNCINLSDIELPKTLTTMGYDVFYNCDSLTEIFIPKALENVSTAYDYRSPFTDCSNLKVVSFEENITFVEHNLFAGCDGLEEIEIPNTVTIINTNAFAYCENLKKVTLSDALTSIGTEAFYNCVSLADIELPKSLTTMGYYAFYNCDSLTKLFIPKALQNVSTTLTYAGPFQDCSSLKQVTFEEGITFVEHNLFAGCDGLEEIVIPNSVITIYDRAFYSCENLKSVTMSNSLISIKTDAFSYCTNLIKIELPDALTTIETNAFESCFALVNIEIPDSVTSMGNSIFYGCVSLETVKLPAQCELIPDGMFQNCTNLKTLELPKTVNVIEASVFSGCTALESIILADGITLNEIGQYAFYNCSSLKEAVLPETVITIGSSAFQNCTALEKVYIPQSTKTLSSYAFKGCEMLSDVTIADYSITTINAQTFMGCPALEKIVLPKGLTTISSQAFMNCTSLTEVVIPESVTSIDSTAFSYPDKTTIYGKSGSYPEIFATENGFTFVDNSVPSEGIALLDGIEYIVMDRGETYRAVFEFYPEDSTDVITLTASNTNVTINGHDIYARYTGDTVITATASSGVTYEFTIHIRNARKIVIATQPNKVSYIMGEELDLTGMVVQVTYNDSTTREVTDYTISGFDSSVEGMNKVTVKWVSPYGSSYTTTFDVEIIDPRPKLTGIVVDTMPTKREYERKESLDLTGLVIKATYTDGSSAEVTDYTVSGYNALKNGIQTITVRYNDFTTTFTVAVGQALIISGDVNGDKVIDAGDAIVISMYDAGLIELTADQLTAADVNGDGVVDAGDAVLISMYDAGLITEF